MLSVRNLVKVYKTKGGAPVRALDGVSVDFPEKGMVFLLGRSGSGKSTLLNMAGGLDEPDSGEIIIKGKSSKDFSKTDFDSYRNTYVGFIFQEYNILNEFNVEQNIALALQLQGKKNDKKAVNALLEQVDLKGMARRKPNTLSGGQKQRIAIARALIKEPEIIMADEPTGALDSRTGRQVLDTLKKLSEKKLVIIVSHDREFAEIYGDRIIELKDGKIISDVSKGYIEPTVVDGNVKFIGDGTVKIEDVDRLSETDVRNILYKLKAVGKEGVITFNEGDVTAVKRALKIGDDGRKETFEQTDTEKAKKESEAHSVRKPKFIKSRLPLRRAVKMGLSGLKTKPVRLIFTVFLSVVAFTLFGVVATMMNFDAAYSVAKAMESSPYDNVELSKNYKYVQQGYSKAPGGDWQLENSYESTQKTLFTEKDVTNLNNNEEGLKFIGVYNYSVDRKLDGGLESGRTFSIMSNIGTIKTNDFYSKNGEIYGFANVKKYCNGEDFTLVGDYPSGDDEIAVSDYIYQSFKAYGYRNDSGVVDIKSEQDLIGKTLNLGNDKSKTFKITGVIKVNGSLYTDSRFTAIKTRADSNEESSSEGKNPNAMTADEKAYANNVSTLNDYLAGSLHTVLFVSDGFYSANKTYFGSNYGGGTYVNSAYVLGKVVSESATDDGRDYIPYFDEETVEKYKTSFTFYSFDPETFVATKTDTPDLSKKGDKYGVYLPVNGDDYMGYGAFSKIISASYEYYLQLRETTQYRSPEEFAGGEAERDAILNECETFFNELGGGNYVTLFSYCKKAYDNRTDGDNYLWEGVENGIRSIKLMNDKNAEFTFEVRGFYVLTGDGESCAVLPAAAINEYNFTREKYGDGTEWKWENKTDYVFPEDGMYSSVVALSKNTVEQTKYMLHFGDGTFEVKMTNQIFQSVDFMASMVSTLKKVFLIVAIVLGVFSALMLFNFISVSISAKAKEIGILRAVGARGTDVFKIFFSEGGFISFICFILSAVAAFFVCNSLNASISEAISIKMLEYGWMEIGLIFAVAAVVSVIATFIPVVHAAKKPPVESIRSL